MNINEEIIHNISNVTIHIPTSEEENKGERENNSPGSIYNQRNVESPDLIPQHRRPKSISLAALLKEDIPKREYLVPPWLRQGESAMIYAAPGVGKSLFALSLALAVAGGGNALGQWSAPKPRRVLFVDGEMPIDDIRARAEMLLPAAGGDLETIGENLHFMARQKQPTGTVFVDLAEESSRETLIAHVKKAGVDLMILDNLSTLATVEDENAAGAFNDTIKFLLRLKQERIACALIHHSNKGGESYRGSSKIATTFEVIIRLSECNSRADDLPGTTRFSLSWDKFRGKRGADGGIPLDISLSSSAPFEEDGKEQEVRWTATPSGNYQLERLLELVRSGDYRNQRELAEAMGVAVSVVNDRKTKAIREGRITPEEWQKYLPGNSRRNTTASATGSAVTDADF